MTVEITLTTIDVDATTFDLYSNIDGFVIPFETTVSAASLSVGYTTSLVPDGTTSIRVQNVSAACSNFIDLVLATTTTTTSSTTSTTTTLATIDCNTSTNSGGAGVTEYQFPLNSFGGILIMDFNAQGVPDKLEILHNGTRVATSGMTATNSGPFDTLYGDPTVPTSAQASATDQFIGSSKGAINTRDAEFFTDTGIVGITANRQQLIWWEYGNAEFTANQFATVRVTGPVGTAWNLDRVCEATTTTTTTTIAPTTTTTTTTIAPTTTTTTTTVAPTTTTTTTLAPAYVSVVADQASINEGTTVTFTVTTANIVAATTVGYTLSGTNITTGDFQSGLLTGTITITGNTGTAVIQAKNDFLTEGLETFTLTLDATDSNGVSTGSLNDSCDIVDTSLGTIDCGAVAASGQDGVTEFTATLENPTGGVFVLDVGPAAVPDKFELIYMGVKVGTSSMTASNFQSPYDNLYGDPTVPTNTQAENTVQFIGTNSSFNGGVVPSREAEFAADTGYTGVTSSRQQLVWFDYTAASYAADNQITIRVTGPLGTVWNVERICESSFTPAYNTLTADSSTVNEGGTVNFDVFAQNIPSATIPYTISGTGITAGDFVTPLTGNITITNGKGTLVVQVATDANVEGTETFTVTLTGNDSNGVSGGSRSDTCDIIDLTTTTTTTTVFDAGYLDCAMSTTNSGTTGGACVLSLDTVVYVNDTTSPGNVSVGDFIYTDISGTTEFVGAGAGTFYGLEDPGNAQTLAVEVNALGEILSSVVC